MTKKRTEPPYFEGNQEIYDEIHVEENQESRSTTPATFPASTNRPPALWVCHLGSKSSKLLLLTLHGGKMNCPCSVLPDCRYINHINGCYGLKDLSFGMVCGAATRDWYQRQWVGLGTFTSQLGMLNSEEWKSQNSNTGPSGSKTCALKPPHTPAHGEWDAIHAVKGYEPQMGNGT